MKKDFVFIDTSVFVAENYWGKKINTLFHFAKEGLITIVLPEVTCTEILSHLNSSISSDFTNIDRLNTGILRHSKDIDNILKALPNKEQLRQDVVDNFNNQIPRSTIHLKTPTNFDLNTILKKYFSREYPFSEKKKAEFPDAIALQLLENWCEEQQCKCICLSRDTDLQKYTSIWIEYKDYTSYIDTKLREKQIVSDAISFAQNSFSVVETDIRTWLDNNLDNDVLYCAYLCIEEIHDYTIEDIIIHDFQYSATNISDEAVFLESKAHIDITVNVSHPDYDTGYYDKEDECWYFINDSIDTIIETELFIPFTVVCDKDEDGIPIIEITEINKNKYLRGI